MQYDLNIPEDNIQDHVDIENDINKRKDGLFTFVLRISNGKITDYNLMEVVDAKTRYLSSVRVSETELVVSRNH